MQETLLHDDNCACFLVEAIAAQSQNIMWNTTVNKNKAHHKRIRRVSIDKFYAIVTGDPDAFLKVCKALPNVIKSVLSDSANTILTPNDTVYDELKTKAANFSKLNDDDAMIMALYILGFNTYNGFSQQSS